MLTEQEVVRREKLEKIKAAGVQAYPERFEVTHTLPQAAKLADGVGNVTVAGRITAIRQLGKLAFIRIQDIEGQLQMTFKVDSLGADKYEIFKNCIDNGDFVGATGEMFTTRTGEKTLNALQFTFLGKCLKPLPEKWHGLTDVELRYRQRYLDLMMNEDSRKRFLLRTALIREMRGYLESQSFLEVETPTLQSNPSGALAKPFKTWHNSLGIELFLRIAPETYLKRCIVGGFNRVFEFARCFRNEGISPNHLQEFTMVEGYAAYWNYEDTMNLMRNMFIHVVGRILGSTKIKIGDVEVDLEQPWPRLTFRELILKDTGIDIEKHQEAPSLLKAIKEKRINLEEEDPEKLGRGNLIDLLYKRVSRPKIVQPSFLVEHPISLSPLARANDKNPELTDRFQLVVNGVELINAYSELVDPVEQMKRLEEQAAAHAGGDEEAMVKDDDYVTCMEFGMPPISGWGIGIDRLLQFLVNCDNIKDCVLFPLSRPKSADGEHGAPTTAEETQE